MTGALLLKGSCFNASRNYLTGDEVLTDTESHLDGVGLVRYGDGGQLEFVPAVHLIGLVHGIFEDLLVPLLAQDGTDIHDFRLAAGPRTGAREEHRHQKQTHRVNHQTGQCSPVAFLPGRGSARPDSGWRHGSATADTIQVGDVSVGGEAKKGNNGKDRWVYVQCGGMCIVIRASRDPPNCIVPFSAIFYRIPQASLRY